MTSPKQSEEEPVPQQLSEFRLIDELFAKSARPGAGVELGIGDDAAVTQLPAHLAGCHLVTATDLLIEGTHFLPGAAAHSVGHRCLAVNLSDLAAMGAQPLWATLGLSVPKLEQSWLDDFAAGFFSLAGRHGVELIGGDTVRGPLALSVTVQGAVPPGEAVTRRGARSGDSVYVTGQPGRAAAGRLGHESFGDAFMYPEPRLALGVSLRGIASSMIDVSDGLHTDLQQLLAASGVAAELDAGQLPLDCFAAAGIDTDEALRLALFGGEDYELLFTAAPEHTSSVQQLAAEYALDITCLGQLSAGAGLRWTQAGQRIGLSAAVFRHFDDGE